MVNDVGPPFVWREIDSSMEPQCDRLAGSCPESGFMQSSSWARFKAKEGYRVRSLGLFQEDSLKGFTKVLDFVDRDPDTHASGFLICPEGPVLDWTDPESAKLALRALTVFCHEHYGDAIGVRIQPNLLSPAPSYLRNWKRGPVDLAPADTLVLDLTLSDDELLSRMKAKGRYNLQVARRHGVEVSASKDVADIWDFYSLFQETALRNHFFAEPLGFFIDLAESLFADDAAELLLARLNGRLLASIIVVTFGHRATYLYGASTSEQRSAMPNYPLHWEAIQRARDRGCTEYDLYGHDPFGRADHLYAGITRFKRQWGGEERRRVGARDYLFYDRLAEGLVARMAGQGAESGG